MLRIDALQNYEIIEVFRDLERSQLTQLRWTAISGVRRTKQCGGPTCYRFEQELRRIQLHPDVFGPAEREIGMIISVVHDLVPFVDDAAYEIRLSFSVTSID